MKIAFDTNILLDLIDERRVGHQSATLLLQICNKNEIEILALADSILTVKYILRKENNVETIEVLELLYDILNVIDTKADAVLKALQICKKYDFDDVEDIAKLFNAKYENCELFVTNDKDLINVKSIGEIDIAVVNVDEILSEFGYQKDLLGQYFAKEEWREKAEGLKKEVEDLINNNSKIEIPFEILKKTLIDVMKKAGFDEKEIEKIRKIKKKSDI